MKYKSNVTLDRHKVRLVAKGYFQTRDIDYEEICFQVAKMNIVRMLLSLVADSS